MAVCDDSSGGIGNGNGNGECNQLNSRQNFNDIIEQRICVPRHVGQVEDSGRACLGHRRILVNVVEGGFRSER